MIEQTALGTSGPALYEGGSFLPGAYFYILGCASAELPSSVSGPAFNQGSKGYSRHHGWYLLFLCSPKHRPRPRPGCAPLRRIPKRSPPCISTANNSLTWNTGGTGNQLLCHAHLPLGPSPGRTQIFSNANGVNGIPLPKALQRLLSALPVKPGIVIWANKSQHSRFSPHSALPSSSDTGVASITPVCQVPFLKTDF